MHENADLADQYYRNVKVDLYDTLHIRKAIRSKTVKMLREIVTSLAKSLADTKEINLGYFTIDTQFCKDNNLSPQQWIDFGRHLITTVSTTFSGEQSSKIPPLPLGWIRNGQNYINIFSNEVITTPPKRPGLEHTEWTEEPVAGAGAGAAAASSRAAASSGAASSGAETEKARRKQMIANLDIKLGSLHTLGKPIQRPNFGSMYSIPSSDVFDKIYKKHANEYDDMIGNIQLD